MQLNVYYNIINIQEKESNILNYNFPTNKTYDNVSVGNPLRSIHAVVIDDTLLQDKNCKSYNSFCFVALSIYPDLTVEYSENYKNTGIGFISSNTYQYGITLNSPFRFSGKFSMS